MPASAAQRGRGLARAHFTGDNSDHRLVDAPGDPGDGLGVGAVR